MTWRKRKMLCLTIRPGVGSLFSGVYLNLTPTSACHCTPVALSHCFSANGATISWLISAYARLLESFRAVSARRWRHSILCELPASLKQMVITSWTPSELQEGVGQGRGALHGCHSKASRLRMTGKRKEPLLPGQHKIDLRCSQGSTNSTVFNLRCFQCSTNRGFRNICAALRAAYLLLPGIHTNLPGLQNIERPTLAQESGVLP